MTLVLDRVLDLDGNVPCQLLDFINNNVAALERDLARLPTLTHEEALDFLNLQEPTPGMDPVSIRTAYALAVWCARPEVRDIVVPPSELDRARCQVGQEGMERLWPRPGEFATHLAVWLDDMDIVLTQRWRSVDRLTGKRKATPPASPPKKSNAAASLLPVAPTSAVDAHAAAAAAASSSPTAATSFVSLAVAASSSSSMTLPAPIAPKDQQFLRRTMTAAANWNVIGGHAPASVLKYKQVLKHDGADLFGFAEASLDERDWFFVLWHATAMCTVAAIKRLLDLRFVDPHQVEDTLFYRFGNARSKQVRAVRDACACQVCAWPKDK